MSGKYHVSICTYIPKDSDKSNNRKRIVKMILKLLRGIERKMKIKKETKEKSAMNTKTATKILCFFKQLKHVQKHLTAKGQNI